MNNELDSYTTELIDRLYAGEDGAKPDDTLQAEINTMVIRAEEEDLTGPIVELFARLKALREEENIRADSLGLKREQLEALARKHQEIDEHMVSVGGRVDRARPIVEAANARVDAYLDVKDQEAPSGIELWDRILENQARIRQALGMDEEAWNTFSGQIRHAVSSVEELARLIELPADAVADIARVTRNYRMRLTPYYTSLIMPRLNDPIMLQSIPTGEMVDNAGVEIPPVAADHSPARLVDQFYPRVVTIKSTNMCAMYCTHCLRIAHIGKKDKMFSKQAYGEALDYIRANKRIRDVLVTGGDAFVLPNSLLKWLLDELDSIDHVRMKRLGTRVPVTVPMRIDDELLDILEASNDRKPLRVVTQINTAQEITPVSRAAFKNISKRVSAVLNQAVLLRGINDSQVKMWKLCETIHESYVRPYYIFNCSYRNPQFVHFRVPVEKGRDIVESMYGNISGDAIPRYIATAGGKIPMHRSNVMGREGNELILKKPWSGEEVRYPDADPEVYGDDDNFSFARYGK
ncbi:glutamate 2,3-aminomutase [Desulfolithobacter dissulfuricans]|uniref:Glutamate 2,3-aminomutase n=1 Tax=Desulfolithobacter dissulfuricans TaxID=2795293 RepID=A0A915U1D7_9BACT|nr:KamA family radical SAM protein [Desulfolithobacter dissulfuricans]BCO09060.1 glutamate 2,3-aminomutase [Desulfolithobacter dissulfuricans]